MEKEDNNPRERRAPEVDFLLQWGNRRRLRCVKVKEEGDVLEKSNGSIRKKTTSRVDFRVVRSPNRFPKNADSATFRSSSAAAENRKSPPQSASPEKEDRYYTTRAASAFEESGAGGKISSMDGMEDKAFVWPKFFVSLSNKEKEEDFWRMKGCKLPQRPKKRAKIIQRYIHLVSPGAWLSDLSQERYEVREKKSSKKRPRGLKAMGSMESDSE
ncbi:hypothetical protein ACLOJK_028726 [Asimina triloba]